MRINLEKLKKLFFLRIEEYENNLKIQSDH